MKPYVLLNGLLIVILLVSGFAPASSGAAQAPTPTATAPTSPTQPAELSAALAEDMDLENFLPNDPVEVVFSEPMDPHSADPALLTYPYLPGELVWSANNTRLAFWPATGFSSERAYYIFLDRDLKSASGQQFEEVQQWQIQAQPGPRVLRHQPVGPTLPDLHPVIRLTFDREMDPQSVREALHIEPPVEFEVKLNKKEVTLTPRAPLTAGQSYHLTLARTARDHRQASMAQEYAWEYWVPEFRATISEITEKTIRLKFNYALGSADLNRLLKIEPAVAGHWSGEGERAVFTAETPLAFATIYTVSATGPLPMNSGVSLAMEPVSGWRKPPIAQVSPQGMVPDARREISIHFLTDMDHQTTEAAFKIQPDMPGQFTWENNWLRFHPEDPFISNNSYTVTLDTTARDAGGQPVLLEMYSWTFSTTYLYDESPWISFGCEGGNVQVMDANGPRTLLFEHRVSGEAIAFALYAVDLPQFAQLYRQYYQERGYYQTNTSSALIPTMGLERAAYWQEQPGNRVQETRLPGNLPAGLYVINASMGGKVQDQLLLALTKNTLVVKHTGTRLWVWASDINGESAPELEIRLYTQDGALMREGKTDPEGIFKTTMPKDSPPMLVAARQGDDVSIAGFWGDWNSNWWSYGKTGTVNQKAYVYTDRPIYKPGQTIYFKAVLRGDDDGSYSLPVKNAPLRVRVLDPRQNEIQSFELEANDFGTVNGETSVAVGAGLGDYTVRAEVGSSDAPIVVGQVVFKVEDYRKPEMQVLLSSEKDRYIAGDSIQVNVDTRYFFGEPVANAQLTIRTYALTSWNWWGDLEAESSDTRYSWYAHGEPKNYRSDAQGHFLYSAKAMIPAETDYDYYAEGCVKAWNSSLRRCTMAVEVTAQDDSGQQVSAVRILNIYNAAVKYSVDADGWLKKPGEKFTVRARAVSFSVQQSQAEQPVANHELRLEVIGWRNDGTRQINQTYDLTTDARGEASVEISQPVSGSYRLRLRPKLGNQGQVSASDWIYVFDSQDRWVGNTWSEFSISTETSHYKPYQSAQLAIQSNFSGPAMLTFERGKVIHQQPIMLTAPVTTIETQIIPEYAPNVYVVVNAWQPLSQVMATDHYGYGWTQHNSRLRTERIELQVESSQKALTVSLTPDQERYAPREEATFTIQVRDSQNRPVEAELSLALVDEAIFALSDDLAGPIFQAFYSRREHTITTGDSLAVERLLGSCGLGRGGGGGDVSPSNPRSDFPDTAAWLPVIHTDAQGKASVTLTLPDNLTTWRVLVKAVTRDTKVGDGEVKILTHQEVIVQPVLPRALTVGDQFELGALVHNYGDQPGELAVSLKSNQLEVAETPIQTITLAAGEVRLVRWKVTAARAGDTEIHISAAYVGADPQNPARQDAVRLPMTIRPRGMPEFDTQLGDFHDELTLTVVAPETMLNLSSVEVKLSRSVAGSLLDGLDYLTGYPYGCVEQTMSRALPNAVVGRAFNQLGVENPNQAKLTEMIAAGVQRLYGFQHVDGGWGWWHDDISTVYQTSWVVFGLAVTADAGYPVDAQVIERGVQYLKDRLANSDGALDLRTRAYILYSLAAAGHGDVSASLQLAEHAAELDPFDQAALVLALHRLGEEQAAQAVLTVLARSAYQSEGMVSWRKLSQDGEYDRKMMASTTRSTAMALNAFAVVAPEHELVPGIVRYLMRQRRANGWGSTNETAYAVLALTDHLQALQAVDEEVLYQILLNGAPISAGKLEWKAPLFTLTIPAGQLKTGINRLQISQTGSQPLFYTVTSRMILDQPQVEAAGKVRVTRAYLDPKTNKPVETLQVGDVVRVRLSAVFRDGPNAYLIFEDPLPGGLEAINERLNNSSHYGGRDYYAYDNTYRFFWDLYGYNQKEVHADRVSFFVTEVPASNGPYVIDYLARVTQPGDFLAPPAQVYAMYDESVWGRSASGEISVSP